MTYNLDHVIAEAAANAIDPDRINYPHLFKEYRFTQEEIDKHQARFKPQATVVEHSYQYLGTLAKKQPKVIKLEEPKYLPWSGRIKVVPRSRLKQAGWNSNKRAERSTVTYLEPDTWLDETTGELITKASARRDNIRIPLAKSISARMLDTLQRIKQCAPSERDFVTYVLKMRNNRGGLVVDLKTAIELWINQAYTDTRSRDKARLRNRLAAILDKRRIMVNSQTLASDLQVLGNPSKQEIIEESARVYDVLKPRAKPGMGAV
ncbi:MULTISPECIES: hypothetical protein [unclassified Caballeronia]|uniref:hypothetical protein n=1 Tax=unclassified Caballeronia TaxID=2646786 RepID=UPI001F233752|nr:MULTISPECIES: hypothetical protein [unclassified Caballeronia]MCE4541394.1 hypothetical protein [Caballeronia sp. PC1]MCE4569562.1 hypothetical protein [Caballeronia sp. CLC5]